ncbi:MAG: J domain-containing protein [Actinobacteria bacterium]|nr:MAG: J domain-containing protein [Actinomycetota bacterium]
MTVGDHYRELQVSRNAEPEVIDKAYRILALKYHPDTGTTGDADRMQRINAAYAVLRDAVSRAAYDRAQAPRDPSGWDVFWDAGLVGLYKQHRLMRRE